MSPIQQMLLGVGAVATKTYVDDIFSTFLYTGTGSPQSINNGIDLSSEGGMVWIKQRGNTTAHVIGDSLRGDNKYLASNSGNGQGTNNTRFKTLTTTGFEVGGDNDTGGSSNNYSSWSFRRSPGFFDVVKFTGNSSSSSQTISHSLGCVPGMIIVKSISNTESWSVYHRELNGGVNAANYILLLDSNSGENASSSDWNNTAATSSSFTVGIDGRVNGSGDYIAYLFAGGESTAATARSLILDGTGDYLSATSSDFAFGTGDFTIEGWFNKDDDSQGGFWDISTTSGGLGLGSAPACAWTGSGGAWQMYGGGDNTNSKPALVPNTWFHVAQVRASGVTTMYVNGIPVITKTDTADYTGTHLAIGGYYSTPYLHEGKISNFRIVKGTAVYTSAFRPPTEPLTNITNTKILCCNDSSTTGKTVGPTITANGDPTASTDSPFDDPAGFTFGENGDQNVIKCGSYVGNGSDSVPVAVHLGFEPQFLLIKRTDSTSNWQIIDSMRGFPMDGIDWNTLRANSTDAETDSYTTGSEPTATGFNLVHSWSDVNASGGSYIYLAIRRSDGYCGKPIETGTGVFTTAASNSGSKPGFTSGFPVDFYLYRKPTASSGWQADWGTYARLIAKKKLWTNKTDVEGTDNSATFAFNNGVQDYDGFDTSYQAWMWKRHAGFDVVATNSTLSTGQSLVHQLGRTPEMIWGKNRSTTDSWSVYHKGLNGGTNPEQYRLKLNDNSAEADYAAAWADTAPTSISFTPGSNYNGGDDPIFLLFASVDGISKVGSYTGTGSGTSGHEITLGFSPRLLIIKRSDGTSNWLTLDTLRGLSTSGNENYLLLSTDGAQVSVDWVNTTSTGFNLMASGNHFNDNGSKFIYYAHA